MAIDTEKSPVLQMAEFALAAYDTAPAPSGGYNLVDPATIGMASASAAGNSVKWTFDNGVYAAKIGSNLANKVGDDTAVANVYEGTASDGSTTLAIVFRGTDGFSADKVLGWGPQMKSGYYPLYKPLINELKEYIATHDVKNVYVTGHSLGAAMTQYAMRDLKDTAKTDFHGVTFGSPGATNSGNTPDDRLLQFEYTGDAFTKLENLPFFSFDNQGQKILMPLDSASTSKDNGVSFYEHKMELYLQAVRNFVNLGQSAPAFIYASSYDAGATARIYAGSIGNDNLYGENRHNDTLLGGLGSDLLDGRSGNDILNGGSGNDTLRGGMGNDKLRGASGDDKLSGGLGSDTLTGNAGDDIFVFKTKATVHESDKIWDFTVSDDTIYLSNSVFKALAGGSLNDEALHLGSAATVDASDHIIYNGSNGRLLYDADGAGGAKALIVAELSANLAITADDFFII